MHRWNVGDEVWGRFYELESDSYVAKILGRVVGVGPKGFAVRLLRTPKKGPAVQRFPHEADVWPTEAAARAALELHPSPSTPGTPRNLRGGGEG